MGSGEVGEEVEEFTASQGKTFLSLRSGKDRRQPGVASTLHVFL